MNYDKSSVLAEQFADIRILRYCADSFNDLNLQEKKLVYYLALAAYSGRDILFDQHFEYNLVIRRVLEEMVLQLHDGPATNPKFNALEVYLKRVWFSSGIHHHYSTRKFEPGFSKADFREWFAQCKWDAVFGHRNTQKIADKICEVIFSDNKFIRRTSQSIENDLVADSCNNFYKNVTQHEAETFYQQQKAGGGETPPSYGLNSRLIKKGIQIEEEKWHIHGKYGKAIAQIVHWLEKAGEIASTPSQKKTIDLLVDYYRTGDLQTFDRYSIEWLADDHSVIDFVNGFIEVYGDPLGLKGSWEALVNMMDKTETQKVKVISQHAQWFEDRSPIAPQYRKPVVSGVSMKIIHALALGGDCYPASPLGINLPNADWIREKHGSKSVSLSNISDAHHLASSNSGVIEEFACDDEEIALHKQYGSEADHLHTHLHECLGHGSGRLAQGITTDMLKAYGSTIEEARADLFALYFMMDPKMEELGLVGSHLLAHTHYNSYIRNGLMVQLTRIELGAKLEQAHMRNRQLIAKWAFEKGKPLGIIEQIERNGKTYFKVKDHQALRNIFGQLLHEIQRIKSEGDYEAAKNLVETYGVNIDYTLHQQILERFAKLNIAPFAGFLNPEFRVTYNNNGHIADIVLDYSDSYKQQMFKYSRQYSFLTDEAIAVFLEEIDHD
ncbi:MAG: dihydrofolate reductase [Breznakibacter sp.]